MIHYTLLHCSPPNQKIAVPFLEYRRQFEDKKFKEFSKSQDAGAREYDHQLQTHSQQKARSRRCTASMQTTLRVIASATAEGEMNMRRHFELYLHTCFTRNRGWTPQPIEIDDDLSDDEGPDDLTIPREGEVDADGERVVEGIREWPIVLMLKNGQDLLDKNDPALKDKDLHLHWIVNTYRRFFVDNPPDMSRTFVQLQPNEFDERFFRHPTEGGTSSCLGDVTTVGLDKVRPRDPLTCKLDVTKVKRILESTYYILRPIQRFVVPANLKTKRWAKKEQSSRRVRTWRIWKKKMRWERPPPQPPSSKSGSVV